MEHSILESRRFGLRVFRHVAEDVDTVALRDAILANDVDLLVLRLPASAWHRLPALGELGMPHLVADTLVDYEADLGLGPAAAPRNPGLELRECGPAERPLLAELVDEIFDDYSGHYLANPLLDADAALAGYREWALGHVREKAAPGTGANAEGHTVFLARLAGEAVAFACCAWQGDAVEAVLYGVRRSATGRGIYGDLIRITKEHFRRQGLARMRMATQLQNDASQRGWAREGFLPRGARVTVHVNALLRASALPALPLEHRFGAAELENPSQALGWLLARKAREALRGRRVRSVRFRELRPLRAGRRCSGRISFPVVEAQPQVAVMQLRDENDAPCTLVYAELEAQPRVEGAALAERRGPTARGPELRA